MSIRPVDLQLGVQRSIEISRVNGNSAEKSELFRQQFKQNLKEQNIEKGKIVVELSKTEKESINKDGKNKEENQKNSDNKDNSNKNQNNFKPKMNLGSTSMFDISV